jgi:hypothetical protein
MKKRKCFTFLFCLTLCFSLFQLTARAQSLSYSVSSQGNITYSLNLAGTESDWNNNPNGYSFYITWESDTVMRLDSRPDGQAYAPYCRENYLKQFPSVTAGQTRIYGKVHIKAAPWSGAPVPYDLGGGNGGGRLVVDQYNAYGVMDRSNPNFNEALASRPFPPTEHYVNFGTEADVYIDYIVPYLNGYAANDPIQIKRVVLDIQVRPENTSGSSVWFSNMQFYILEPGENPPPLT